MRGASKETSYSKPSTPATLCPIVVCQVADSMKCDPDKCPRNGQNLAQAIPRLLSKHSSDNERPSKDQLTISPARPSHETDVHDTYSDAANKSSAAVSQPSLNAFSRKETLPKNQELDRIRSTVAAVKRYFPGGQEGNALQIGTSSANAPPEDRYEYPSNYRTSMSPIPVSPLAYEAKPLVLEPSAIDDDYSLGLEDSPFSWMVESPKEQTQFCANPRMPATTIGQPTGIETPEELGDNFLEVNSLPSSAPSAPQLLLSSERRANCLLRSPSPLLNDIELSANLERLNIGTASNSQTIKSVLGHFSFRSKTRVKR